MGIVPHKDALSAKKRKRIKVLKILEIHLSNNSVKNGKELIVK